MNLPKKGWRFSGVKIGCYRMLLLAVWIVRRVFSEVKTGNVMPDEYL